MSERISFTRRRVSLLVALASAAAAAGVGFAGGGPAPSAADRRGGEDTKPVKLRMFAPENGDRAGLGGRGWFVDLEADFDVPLERTGFTGLQLTGPAAHNNTAPFPGQFAMGQDDRFKGLVVLVSTNSQGAGRNVANLFNLTGVTDRGPQKTEIWDTWIVGAPLFGRDVESTVYAAIVADRDGNGVYDDAPDVIPDADADGDVDAQDLKALGVASNIERASFRIVD